jgi:UDPglucose 6-dehydrogenase
MKIGMIGLGKLGLPCLLAMEKHGGHEIYGYDKSPSVIKAISEKSVAYWEDGVNELLATSQIEVVSEVATLVKKCDIIFVAVQTPHDPEFEGRTPVPDTRKDFDYAHLIQCAQELSDGLTLYPESNPLIVVISTVLPGTMNNFITPILKKARPDVRFAYNPYFIAMGTTIKDFLNPEFFLIGSQNPNDAAALQDFYGFIKAPVKTMLIESAELTKVAYNTFIGFKIKAVIP